MEAVFPTDLDDACVGRGCTGVSVLTLLCALTSSVLETFAIYKFLFLEHFIGK